VGQARELENAAFAGIAAIPARRSRVAIPASPCRSMDAGAIGSLSADYPLCLTPPAGDARIRATVTYLMDKFFFNGGFFQDMIPSEINAYLSLAIAWTMLRSGDARYRAVGFGMLRKPPIGHIGKSSSTDSPRSCGARDLRARAQPDCACMGDKIGS
jgi:hypothetical protein